MSKITIYIPIYRNENNIIPCYESIMKEIVPYIDDYEILMINDASPDNSWTIMKELADKDNHVRLISHTRNFGAMAATYTAMKYATGDCFMPKACDLQEPSNLAIDMYKKWREGSKVVLAVRKSREDSAVSNFFSNGYYALVRKLAFSQMPKSGFDTYLIDSEVMNTIVDLKEPNSNIGLQLLWTGYKPEQVFYDRKKREIGKSSWSFAKKMKLFIDSIVNYSYIPMRFMSVLGFVYAIISFVLMIVTVIGKISGRIPVEGYTTLLIIILLSFGIIMCFFGIIGEYIWRILDISKRKPIAVVDEIYSNKSKEV